MPQRKEPLIPGEYYHIFNRGINSQVVFQTDRNYFYFLRKTKEYLTPKIASIIAYVLMPTHYHLLVQINHEDFSLAMGRIGNSYTKAYNLEWDRTGPLFEGRFKSKLVNLDEYVLRLSLYIHLNPVSSRLVEKPEDWPYSSYLDLIGIKEGVLPLINLVHSYFDYSDPHFRYQNFVEAGLKSQDYQFSHLLFD